MKYEIMIATLKNTTIFSLKFVYAYFFTLNYLLCKVRSIEDSC